MSFCDFAEDVEDAYDHGEPYDHDEASKNDAPQLLWLSDIPLFRSVKAVQRPDFIPGGTALIAAEEDTDTELQCTFQPCRVAYRDESGGSAGIRILEAIPDWFAFTSSSYIDDPDDMLNILKEMLKSRDTTTPTFKISSTHYQITGSVIHDEKTMEFQINIFRSSKYGGSLVEFQRQSGSVRDFLAFHRQCIAHITAE